MSDAREQESAASLNVCLFLSVLFVSRLRRFLVTPSPTHGLQGMTVLKIREEKPKKLHYKYYRHSGRWLCGGPCERRNLLCRLSRSLSLYMHLDSGSATSQVLYYLALGLWRMTYCDRWMPFCDFLVVQNDSWLPTNDFFMPPDVFWPALSDFLLPTCDCSMPLSDSLLPICDFLVPLNDS